MNGKDRFTADEADRIRDLLTRRAVAARAEQKRLRDELRALGFYISDWSGPGLTANGFDELANTGRITIVDASRATTPPARALARHRPKPTPARVKPQGAASPRSPSTVVELAVAGLSAPRHPLADADAQVPAVAGLYAIYGPADVWRELTLGDPPDDRPLYVGKAEDSLVARDLKTHFGSGRTGSSTVRRSFAALLREHLELRAQPRNPARPERFANYGLSPDGDARLTRWMRDRLSLTTWPKPSGVQLLEVERELLKLWRPPLNLRDVDTPWHARVMAARKAMADDARAWSRQQP